MINLTKITCIMPPSEWRRPVAGLAVVYLSRWLGAP
jgi:hypothetical protein